MGHGSGAVPGVRRKRQRDRPGPEPIPIRAPSATAAGILIVQLPAEGARSQSDEISPPATGGTEDITDKGIQRVRAEKDVPVVLGKTGLPFEILHEPIKSPGRILVLQRSLPETVRVEGPHRLEVARVQGLPEGAERGNGPGRLKVDPARPEAGDRSDKAQKVPSALPLHVG